MADVGAQKPQNARAEQVVGVNQCDPIALFD